MQRDFHDWYRRRFRAGLSTGNPIDGVKRSQLGIVAAMGYQKGTPDYTMFDPRVHVWFDAKGKVHVRVIPWMVFEFKTPKGTGTRTDEQKAVLENMRKREKAIE